MGCGPSTAGINEDVVKTARRDQNVRLAYLTFRSPPPRARSPPTCGLRHFKHCDEPTPFPLALHTP